MINNEHDKVVPETQQTISLSDAMTKTMAVRKHTTIMMVDDDPIMMDFVQIFLEDAGYRKIICEDDSRRAIAVIEAARPDILLLDLVMPNVSGFDILEIIRKHETLKHLPVLVLTSATDTETKLRALELGATDFLSKPVDQSELRLRVRNTLSVKAYQDQLAYHDPVTNLPNRKMFTNVLERNLSHTQVKRRQIALLSVELDQFERVADTMGLSVSDEVLLQVGQRISHALQATDAVSNSRAFEDLSHNLARFDRGTFYILLYPIDANAQAAQVARRINTSINAPLKIDSFEIDLTASIGISMSGQQSRRGEELIDEAARAKDSARQSGGNCIHFASASVDADYARGQRLQANLRRAVALGEMELVYQPKVSLLTGNIIGAETLMRWNSKIFGPISPVEFIPIAEESGLIIEIGEWLLDHSCQTLFEWQQRFATPLTLAVNISMKQFVEENFVAMAATTIHRSNIDAKYLTLELTESLMIEGSSLSVDKLLELRQLGVCLSIDDFGTGYSSLSYLEQLPVDELKIDRSFLQNITDSKRSESIVRAIITLAQGLGLKTVVEGIETEAQLNLLKHLGCNIYQGYYFSPPVAKEEFERLFIEQQTDLINTGTQ